MKFFKNHFRLIVMILILILVGIGAYFVKEFFFSNENEAIYGSRIKDIKKYPIKDEEKKKIEEGIMEHAEKCDIRIAGRLVYVDVYVKPGIDIATAKSFGNIVLENLSDDQKGYYDIQILVGSKTNDSEYPLIGYKHHKKAEFRWANKITES